MTSSPGRILTLVACLLSGCVFFHSAPEDGTGGAGGTATVGGTGGVGAAGGEGGSGASSTGYCDGLTSCAGDPNSPCVAFCEEGAAGPVTALGDGLAVVVGSSVKYLTTSRAFDLDLSAGLIPGARAFIDATAAGHVCVSGVGGRMWTCSEALECTEQVPPPGFSTEWAGCAIRSDGRFFALDAGSAGANPELFFTTSADEMVTPEPGSPPRSGIATELDRVGDLLRWTGRDNALRTMWEKPGPGAPSSVPLNDSLSAITSLSAGAGGVFYRATFEGTQEVLAYVAEGMDATPQTFPSPLANAAGMGRVATSGGRSYMNAVGSQGAHEELYACTTSPNLSCDVVTLPSLPGAVDGRVFGLDASVTHVFITRQVVVDGLTYTVVLRSPVP